MGKSHCHQYFSTKTIHVCVFYLMQDIFHKPVMLCSKLVPKYLGFWNTVIIMK